MDSGLRLAWTQIVTSEDYDQHMAAIGQAQAAADLTAQIIRDAGPPADSRIVIAGAGTGQMFEFMDAALFQPFRLICTDLNPMFLRRLRERVVRHNIAATVFADDIEQTALAGQPDLLVATLLLEHIDWGKGVDAIVSLGPAACAFIIQENPAGMTSAVTPGRSLPRSITEAVRIGHPTLVPRDELITALDRRNYRCTATQARDVADGKRLVSMLFRQR